MKNQEGLKKKMTHQFKKVKKTIGLKLKTLKNVNRQRKLNRKGKKLPKKLVIKKRISKISLMRLKKTKAKLARKKGQN